MIMKPVTSLTEEQLLDGIREHTMRTDPLDWRRGYERSEELVSALKDIGRIWVCNAQCATGPFPTPQPPTCCLRPPDSYVPTTRWLASPGVASRRRFRPRCV